MSVEKSRQTITKGNSEKLRIRPLGEEMTLEKLGSDHNKGDVEASHRLNNRGRWVDR